MQLTLSKIRKLRRLGAWLWKTVDLELGTVALGFAYFEKCIWQGIVDKFNRKVIYVCCLVLAYKFNEAVDVQRKLLDTVVPEIEKAFVSSSQKKFAIVYLIGLSLFFGSSAERDLERYPEVRIRGVGCIGVLAPLASCRGCSSCLQYSARC